MLAVCRRKTTVESNLTRKFRGNPLVRHRSFGCRPYLDEYEVKGQPVPPSDKCNDVIQQIVIQHLTLHVNLKSLVYSVNLVGIVWSEIKEEIVSGEVSLLGVRVHPIVCLEVGVVKVDKWVESRLMKIS